MYYRNVNLSRRPSDSADLFRRFLKERRGQTGLSQRAFAEQAGLSRDWVASFESGRLPKVPRPETLKKISAALHLPGETQGTVFNFMTLIVAGVLAEDLVLDVAAGRLDAATAMSNATRGVGVAMDDRLASTKANAVHARTARLYHALGLLAQDLDEQDLVLVRNLLWRLYGNAPLPGPTMKGEL